jgi:putative endopeptidase
MRKNMSSPLLAPLEREGMPRKVAAYTAAAAILTALVLVLTSQQLRQPAALAEVQNANVNDRFLQATGGGEAGKSFLQRLQNIWFVEEYTGHQDLAADGTELASSVMIAGFPEDMHAAVDVKVNPCDDFYEFACGKWDDDNKQAIPAYKSQVAFAWDRAEKKIRETESAMLEKDEGPAGAFYRSCMDLERIEKVGEKPVMPWLKYVDAISDTASLATAVTEFNKHNMDNFFTWWIDTDTRDSSRKVFTIAQGGFTLPEKTYYLENSAIMKQHRDSLVSIASRFFQLVGYPKAESDKRARGILHFETELAKITVDKEEARKDHGAPSTWGEVQELMPGWPWKDWLRQLASCTAPPDEAPKVCSHDHAKVLGVGEPGMTPLYLMNKSFFPKLNSLLASTDIDTLKAVMAWKLLRNSALYLSSGFIDLMVEFNADLYGVSQKNPRARKCYYSVQSSTPWPMAKLYVDNAFHSANRDAVLEMLHHVRGRFDAALATEEWMAAEDRVAAQEKLRKMFFQVAYPTDKADAPAWPKETWDMDGKIGTDFFTNFMLTNRLSVERDFERIAETPNRRDWGGSSPLMVNAFYGPNNNGLWIPAGILQSPFFDAANSDARNYGSIGSVLGHEMSHGFDDNGRQYDARGELHGWWSAKTVAAYEERSGCISDLFSTYAIGERHVNGKYTLGEDIADAGGLKFSYQAFVTKEPRTLLDKRIFFTSFAQTWCSVQRRKSAVSSVLSDTHAPSKFRVIGGLSQFAPFAEAFQCPIGAPMAPAKRCELW